MSGVSGSGDNADEVDPPASGLAAEGRSEAFVYDEGEEDERPYRRGAPAFNDDADETRLETPAPARVALHPHDPHTREEIMREEVVKGYEYERGRFVTFTAEELKALDVEGSKIIVLETFVPRAEVDPVYFSPPYYVYDRGRDLCRDWRSHEKSRLGRHWPGDAEPARAACHGRAARCGHDSDHLAVIRGGASALLCNG